MANKYDPMTNVPGYIPPAPTLQQGMPLQGFPLSLEGVSQEALRQEMMRRTGQYGPLPMHRTRGVIGGSFSFASAAWQEVARDDHWHADAAGAQNAGWKTLFTKMLGNVQPFGAGTPGPVLGAVCQITFGAGGVQLYSQIFDIPTNGMVKVPMCAETVIARIGLTRTVYTSTEITALGTLAEAQAYFDNPPTNINPANVKPIAYVGVVQSQSLAPNRLNMPSRHLSVNLSAGNDSAVLPVPASAQSVLVLGEPADLKASFETATASNTFGFPVITPSVPATIPTGTVGVAVSSAAAGGLVTVIFYLGL